MFKEGAAETVYDSDCYFIRCVGFRSYDARHAISARDGQSMLDRLQQSISYDESLNLVVVALCIQP